MKTNERMNIPTGDLYSMYVVLQGIGSLSCIRVYIVIPFGEWQPWMSEVPKLEHFNKKTGPPTWSISFYIAFKKLVFQAHRRGPPTTSVGELWKKTILQWKPMEPGGFPEKIDEYFSLGTYILCM